MEDSIQDVVRRGPVVFKQAKATTLIAGVILAIIAVVLVYVSFWLVSNGVRYWNLFPEKGIPSELFYLGPLPLLAAIPLGVFSFRSLRLALNSGPRLRLDSVGFTDIALPKIPIQWKDIFEMTFVETTVRQNGIDSHKLFSIRILLNYESEAAKKLPYVRRRLKQWGLRDYDLAIDVSNLTAEPETVFAYFDEFRSQFGSDLVREETIPPISHDDIARQIAAIDLLIELQLNEILHHEEFKALEATWRGLHYFLSEVEPEYPTLKVRILTVTKRDLLKDFEKSMEIDQSQMYRKVFSEIFENDLFPPFGMLLGAYEFGSHPQDLALLTHISKVSAVSHAPFITGVAPHMFGWDSFEEIKEVRSFLKVFSLYYENWRKFRKLENARYVGLCMPHILLRDPYVVDNPFRFQESRTLIDGSARFENGGLLWGNSAFAFGVCVAKAFKEKGWLGELSGLDGDGGVKGTFFQEAHFGDASNVEYSLDGEAWNWNENAADELSTSGFMPLIDVATNGETEYNAYFFGTHPTYEPKESGCGNSDTNEQPWTQLENTLNASRFAIYLMCIWRDYIGSVWNWHKRHTYFLTREQWENLLQTWLDQYVCSDVEADEKTNALRPLRSAYVRLEECQSNTDTYRAILQICPASSRDDIVEPMRIEIDLPDLHWNRRQES